MKKIQMVDLQSQYKKIKNEIDFAIHNVMDTAEFVNGSDVTLFENELSKYCNVNYTIGCGNGTDALQIALMALDLKAGDEIITPAFTFVATAEVIALLGLTPVFVDIDPHTFNIDVNKIEKSISSRTKAIIPVHLFGQCAYMKGIMKIAEKYNLYVIEDTAQAIGTKYFPRKSKSIIAGTIGHIGTTSFFPSKNLGCYGDGGALFTNDEALAKKIKTICNHGSVEKYHHDYIGINSRLDSIQAAILSVKLLYLDNYIAERKKVAEFYNTRFAEIPEIEIPYVASYSEHTYHQYTIKMKNKTRNKLLDHLLSKDIPAKIYYPVPLHFQNAFKYLNYKYRDLPVTEKVTGEVISLPMHTELTIDQLEYITETILDFLR